MIYLCKPLKNSQLTNKSFQWLSLDEVKKLETPLNVIRLIELTEKLLIKKII